MPIVDVEENINKLRENIEKMTQEVFRMQGMLQTFEGFKKGGLKQIDLPRDPNQKPVEEVPKQDMGGKIVSTLMANPSLMAMAAAAMNNINSSGKVPNQALSDEELKSVQEKPE